MRSRKVCSPRASRAGPTSSGRSLTIPTPAPGTRIPIYDRPDWSKDFDVVVHDECSSDVNDMNVIETILEPHKNGLPAVVLHCGMHSYRTEGWNKKVATPWMQFTGLISTGHGPQEPIAVKFVDKEPRDHQGSGRLDDRQRGALQQRLRQARAHGTCAGERHAGLHRLTRQGSHGQRPWSPGPTPTRARPGSSPPPSATTTRPSTILATLTWLPAACSGRSINLTPSISRPPSRVVVRGRDESEIGPMPGEPRDNWGSGSPHAPFPEAERGLLVERMARLLEGPANLAAVVRFMGDEVPEKCRGVGLEALHLSPRGDGLAEQVFDGRSRKPRALSGAGPWCRLSSFPASPGRSSNSGAADLSHIRRTLWMCAN